MPIALFTGVAGFVGSNLAEELLEQGYTVRGLDNFETGRQSNVDPLEQYDGFSFYGGDVRDRDVVSGEIENVK